jgi:hypothetical protein
MSFSTFNKEKLLNVAEYFAVEGVDDSNTKAEILNAIQDTPGATWANYKKLTEPEASQAPEVKAEVEDSIVLLKMERQNPRFDVFGYTFTKDQPFKAMSEETAQKIIDVAEGFRLASPAEAKSFYN